MGPTRQCEDGNQLPPPISHRNNNNYNSSPPMAASWFSENLSSCTSWCLRHLRGIGVVMVIGIFLVAVIAGIIVGALMGGGSQRGITILPASPIEVNKTNLVEYKEKLNALHEEYKKAAKNATANIHCKIDKPKESDENCWFDIEWLRYPCRMVDDWGYTLKRSQPCIILRPEKDEDWTPEPYDSYGDLPKDMPQDLKDKIELRSRVSSGGKTIDKVVWLWCEGETDEDTRNMGMMVTSPWYGFPVHYFPYRTSPSYQQPILGLYFPDLAIGVEVNVKCRIWEKNTDPNKNPLRFTIKRDL